MNQRFPSHPAEQGEYRGSWRQAGPRPSAAGGGARVTLHQRKASVHPRGRRLSFRRRVQMPGRAWPHGGGAALWDGPRSWPAGATQAQGQGDRRPPDSLALGLKCLLVRGPLKQPSVPSPRSLASIPRPDMTLAIYCCSQTAVASRERPMHRAGTPPEMSNSQHPARTRNSPVG